MEAAIEGALQDAPSHGHTDDQRAACESNFPCRQLGKGDLALVIQARTETGKDEIRFAMRSRAEDPARESRSR